MSVCVDYCNFDSAVLLQIHRKIVKHLAYVCLEVLDRREVGWLTVL